jgi:hypothetical protein
MKLIERINIDTNKWDLLVQQSGGDVFSLSWYLDALANEWCIITDDDYTKGIAIPYTKKFGIKLGYIPVFSRYVEWFGSTEYQEDAINLLQDSFHGYNLRVRSNIELQNEVELVHQCVNQDTGTLGRQANRMLNKAAKNEYSVEESFELKFALSIIGNELAGKFKGVDDSSIHRLRNLCVSAAREKMLRIFSVDEIGAIICIQSGEKLLYLKGTATELGKKNGAMYALMQKAIDFSASNKLIFDFGGSTIEGVRKFNQNLGGMDEIHFGYSKNNAPFWYNLLRRIKHKGNY